MKTFCLLIFVLTCQLAKGQSYFQKIPDAPLYLLQDQDSAMLIVTRNNVSFAMSKLDQKLSQIWEIGYDPSIHGWNAWDVKKMSDGSSIISGSTFYFQRESGGDPFLLKLNACYEPIWCKAIQFNGGNMTHSIITSLDEVIVFNTGEDMYHKHAKSLNEPQQTIYGYKWDAQGNLIWRKRLFTGFNINATITACQLLNNKVHIIGRSYYTHPLSPTSDMVYSRSFTIITDTALNVLHYWHNDSNTYYDIMFGLCRLPKYNYVTIRGGTLYDVPVLYDEKDIGYLTKLDSNLNIVYQREYPMGDSATFYSSLMPLRDSSKILSITCQEINVSTYRILRKYFVNFESSDSFNTLLSKSLDILPYDTNLLVRVSKSYQLLDGTIWLSGDIYNLNTQRGEGFIIRLTENLDYDTAVVALPAMFDPLCNKPIVSTTLSISDIDTLYFPQLVTGVREINERPKQVNIFPNPAQNTLSVQANAPIVSIKIYDVTGKVIFYKSYESGLAKIDEDISYIPNGIYYLECTIGNESTIQKLSVVK